MAANDYYSSYSHSTPHDQSHYGRPGPVPSPSYPSSQNSIPETQTPTASRSHLLSSSNSRLRDDSPFDSSNDIPLQSTHSKNDRDHYNPYAEQHLERQPSDTLPLNPDSHSRRSRSKKKKRIDWKKIPWVVYILSLIQITVFIAELVKNAVLTGTPIEIHPNFNPMIGPSPFTLINMGARYVPCMRNEKGVQDSRPPITLPCPNSTAAIGTCSLSDLCGFGGVPNPSATSTLTTDPHPHQWWRFIVPIFLHGGIIHILGNMLLQLSLGRDMEKAIGSVRFFLVYFSSGIFGFVLGGNFAQGGLATTGCSGSLFGIVGLVILDLLYTWESRPSPIKDLLFLIAVIVIEVAIGLLPTTLDNFSHIGGLLIGLVLGISVLHSPNSLRKHWGDASHLPGDDGQRKRRRQSKPISSNELIYGTQGIPFSDFIKEPAKFFRGRKPLWWVWWLFRAGALVAVFVGFIVLLNNFYKTSSSNCSWCKYMSCIDVKNWCDQGNLQAQTTTFAAPGATAAPTNPARLAL